MPALSPTMTEGNITSWKVKEGDSFVAGDVLLEIETDKAQMDVEAQDDGIVAKIIVQDGAKAVQVGARIAVTAEPGDDLSSLDIPAEDNPSPKRESSAKETPKEQSSEPPKEDKPAPKHSGSSDATKKPSGGKAQKQTYPLYPSVQHLLKENGLGKSEADKIPATGPNGRLLKGDVLSYLGRIEESYAAESAKRIASLAHLDLSNIKVAAPKKEAPSKKTEAATEAPTSVSEVEIALSVSLKAVIECQKRVQESIGVFLPISTFIARATELANEDLPRSKTSKPSADELFDAVLGLDKIAGRKYARGHFAPQITAMPLASLGARAFVGKKPDILDILSGKKSGPRSKKVSTTSGTTAIAPLNVFSISVPKGDEKRGQVFLERVKSVLEAEPGRLVV
ncbi:pyruvate dehydrogenase protein x component [Pleomassaria siparia CBS 279.74]|uniref:Pyruvate dehydrogenase protein x component n=1 Tax=Pleomassaria siparia CBS 279.74 TaxID=1314801 RepID=A0A6G1KAR6_9PLEO|nr:pyruvate dehydrogenase protein x component [Pleomassaria siparia CBS 279.74]